MSLTISVHAVQRYRERVKSALDAAACKAELEALAGMAGEIERPAWVTVEPDAERYLLLADGIVAVVKGGYVATVLTRGSLGPERRRERNQAKARRRRARRDRNQKRQKQRRDGRPESDPSGWGA